MIYKDTLYSVIGKGCCRSNFRFPCYLLPPHDSSGWKVPLGASSSPKYGVCLSPVGNLLGLLQRHVDVGADVDFAPQRADPIVFMSVIRFLLHA